MRVECPQCGTRFTSPDSEDEATGDYEPGDVIDFCSPECQEVWMSSFFPDVWGKDAE